MIDRACAASAAGRCDRNRAGSCGFSIIELMITIAIVAILMLLAGPSFVNFQKNSELTSTINNLAASISTAREEAMRSNTTVSVVPDGNWAAGWKVSRADGTVVDQEYMDPTHPGISSNLSFVKPTGATQKELPVAGFRFNGEGYPQLIDGSGAGDGVLQLTNQLRQRQLQLLPTGQVRVCDPAAATGTNGACS